jgi:hypothetical protein
MGTWLLVSCISNCFPGLGASPLALAGKAEARGSAWLHSGCSQPEPLPNLPNCLPHDRGPSDVSDFAETDLTRNSDASADHPDSSVHSEGRPEHRDGKLPMVTSALSKQLRFPSQGSDRQLPDGTSVSEGVSVQAKAAVLTGLGDRPERLMRINPMVQESESGLV